MALYRKCEYCGERISLRQMPGGQWVAFDVGTKKVHNCNSKPLKTPLVRSKVTKSAKAAKTESATDTSVAVKRTEQIHMLLKQAVTEHRCVRLIYYTASRGAITDRVVEPLALEAGEWGGTVLRAYCRWRLDLRTFALSNIKDAVLLEETFSPRSWPEREVVRKAPHFEPSTSNNERVSRRDGRAIAGYVVITLWLIELLIRLVSQHR